MKLNLTDDAKVMLDEWFSKQTQHWQAVGADVDEVREDVETHLSSEFADSESPVGISDVRAALGRMEMPETGLSADEPTETSVSSAYGAGVEKRSKRRWFARLGSWVTTHWFWVVLWPALVIGFEAITGMSNAMFFNPLPTWWHMALLLLTCAAGAFHYVGIRQKNKPYGMLHEVSRYAALVICFYWSLLLLPLVVMGTMAYGVGVFYSAGIVLIALPLYLLCVLTAGAPMLLGAGLLRSKGRRGPSSSKWIGVLLGVTLLVLLEGPSYITRYGLASDNPRLIRRMGSERTLLRMCYEGRGGRASGMDTTGYATSLLGGDFIWGPSESVDLEKRRKMYYRVTGKAFNSVAPPSSSLSRKRIDSGVVFDEDLGGDGVFARVSGLQLSESRLDGHIDNASNLGYWEWTAEFSNSGGLAKEAR